MMEKPDINMSTLYGTVADLMPQEGRDFTVDSMYGADRKPVLVVEPLTDLGRAWVPHLKSALVPALSPDGVTVAGTAVQVPESSKVTVRSLREKIEDEADAEMAAKIQKAADEAAAKYEASKKAREEFIAQNGETAELPDSVRSLVRDANSASTARYKIQRVAANVKLIRGEITGAAIAAAKADEPKGKFWAIDMDAPLTSLFDRQDVQNKVRHKEQLVYRMAELKYEIDELKDSAVYNLKQYALHKGV